MLRILARRRKILRLHVRDGFMGLTMAVGGAGGGSDRPRGSARPPNERNIWRYACIYTAYFTLGRKATAIVENCVVF
jgi:hypothetical protein